MIRDPEIERKVRGVMNMLSSEDQGTLLAYFGVESARINAETERVGILGLTVGAWALCLLLGSSLQGCLDNNVKVTEINANENYHSLAQANESLKRDHAACQAKLEAAQEAWFGVNFDGPSLIQP